MSDHSAIEWTDTTSVRIRATAAARVGVSLEEYDRRRSDGQKWCGGCKSWHNRSSFSTDNSRGDGLAKWCRVFTNEHGRARYTARPRPTAGRRFVGARDGDQAQARRRVNHLVETGLIPRPNSLPCADCGHLWQEGERRHEYDHHLGYAPEHHEDVEAVCTKCHHQREDQRRAA